MEMQFTFKPGDVKQDAALIYKWEIRDEDGNLRGLYIGKAKGGSKRPLSHYRRNVNRLLVGKPYRLNNPDGFRKSHRALAHAVESGYTIELSLVANIGPDQKIDRVEQDWIAHFNCCGAEGWQLNQ